MNVDRIGKLAGIVMSCGFLVFATVYLLIGKLHHAQDAELQTFYILLIILAGPIIYFFANAGGNKVELTSRAGRFVIGGGYAVAIAAVLGISILLPPRHAWCVVTIDTGECEIKQGEMVVRNVGTRGRVYQLRPDPNDPEAPCRFVCYFWPGAETIDVRIVLADPITGKRALTRRIQRKQCPETVVALASDI